jgi:sortase B
LQAFFFVSAALFIFFSDMRGYAEARNEYSQLRVFFPAPQNVPAERPLSEILFMAAENETVSPGPNYYERAAEAALVFPDAEALSKINRDYIGWITVGGTPIDYPLVRGADNEHYVNTTFSGRANPSGAIFSDYRNATGFSDPITVLYGHNMKNGTMFAPLMNFLQDEFLAANNGIIIYTAEGEALLYRVLGAVRTNVENGFFSLNGGTDGRHLLVLATCILGADKDARLIVTAELITKIN